MPHHLTDLRIFQIGISLNFSFSNKTQVISSTSISYIGFPWDSPGKNTGVGCRFLLQGISPTQGLNLGLLYCRQIVLPTQLQGKFFPGRADGKESACSMGDLVLIPGMGTSLGEGNGNPLQYCCLENSMDRVAWWGYSPWAHRVRHD